MCGGRSHFVSSPTPTKCANCERTSGSPSIAVCPAGWQALEGAELAPGKEETLRKLNKRPARPQDPIPELPATVPAFSLSEKKFCQNVRSARRGVAGPSGMTADHVQPFLESARHAFAVFGGRTVGQGSCSDSNWSHLEDGQNDRPP